MPKGTVIVAHGYSAPELPYYAQRKMLTENGDIRQGTQRFTASLAALRGEQIGAILMPATWPDSEKEKLIKIYLKEFQFKTRSIEIVDGFEIHKGL